MVGLRSFRLEQRGRGEHLGRRASRASRRRWARPPCAYADDPADPTARNGRAGIEGACGAVTVGMKRDWTSPKGAHQLNSGCWSVPLLNDRHRRTDQKRPCRCLGVRDAARTNLSVYLVSSAMTMPSSSGDVNGVFPHKACINLDRDVDTWGRLHAELTRHDIRGVRRFSAVDGSRLELPATWRYSAGAYGCLLSHLQVVRDARQRGLPSLLILEDDVVFDPSFGEKFPVFVRGVPQTGTWSSSGPCIATIPCRSPRMSSAFATHIAHMRTR